MTALTTRTIEKTVSLPLLQRIADKDTTAVNDCIEAYGNFIWALARRFTDSIEEAEAATQEIFLDIWHYSQRAEQTTSDERQAIVLIAKRRLIVYLQAKRTKIYDEHRETTNKGRERTREENEQGEVAASRIGFYCTESGSALNGKNVEDKIMNYFKCQPRILYAEDDEDSRELVCVQCELSGIKVVTAQTVAEAWRTAQNESFDLYLLDSRFPDGDGLDLCRRLRRLLPLAPILFYSGDAYERHRQNGLAAGANDYLTKPFMGDLAATISESIERSEEFAAQSSGKFLYQNI